MELAELLINSPPVTVLIVGGIVFIFGRFVLDIVLSSYKILIGVIILLSASSEHRAPIVADLAEWAMVLAIVALALLYLKRN